jgi:hypothetical protein
LSIQTPFVFKLSIVKSVSDIDTIKKLLDPGRILVSEFLLYSYLVDRPRKTICKHITFWPINLDLEIDYEFKNLPDNVVVVSFHRGLLSRLNNHQIMYLNEHLESIGLKNKLTNIVDL